MIRRRTASVSSAIFRVLIESEATFENKGQHAVRCRAGTGIAVGRGRKGRERREIDLLDHPVSIRGEKVEEGVEAAEGRVDVSLGDRDDVCEEDG